MWDHIYKGFELLYHLDRYQRTKYDLALVLPVGCNRLHSVPNDIHSQTQLLSRHYVRRGPVRSFHSQDFKISFSPEQGQRLASALEFLRHNTDDKSKGKESKKMLHLHQKEHQAQ
jgi:hypothetical protein